MKDIDFLPLRYREQTAHRKTQYWRVVVLAAFTGLLSVAALGQFKFRRWVEAELAAVRPTYDDATASAQRLASLQAELRNERATAELLTYLRHPWPRTQILADLAGPLIDEITLDKVQLHQEEITLPAVPVRVNLSPEEAAKAAAEAARPPSEKALQRLRDAFDTGSTIVTVEGTSRDATSLHVYLGRLAATGQFSKTELRSIEQARAGQRDGYHFIARLTVRPGYGQTGGPEIASASPATPGKGNTP